MDAISDNLAAVNERLDELSRQLERIAQTNSGIYLAANSANERAPDRVADALARLDRRLDQVVSDRHAHSNGSERQARLVPPPAAPSAPSAPAHRSANWAAQISARQRALDAGATARPASPSHPSPAAPSPALTRSPTFVPSPPAAATPPVAPSPPPAPASWGPGPDLSGLEQQLREINTQISTQIASLQEPYEHALAALRSDLAEISRSLNEAAPRQAIEALEGEVRALAEQLDRTRQAGGDESALVALEHGLAEVRDALYGLTPAESLAALEETVRGLSLKIDQIAMPAHAAQDPLAFQQIEQAVVSLQDAVSNVASDSALDQLRAEVHTLAAQFERAIVDSSAETLSRLEERIAALMESDRAMRPELEASIRELTERFDRMQLSQGDQLALGALEDRIAKLSEKLDASDARLIHLEAIERGLADLLVYVEEMRNGGWREPPAAAAPGAARASPPEPAPAAPLEPAPEAPRFAPESLPPSPLDLILEPPAPTPATIQAPAFATTPAPAVAAEPPATEITPEPAPKAAPRAPERPPIDSELPPDTPLEPGSGTPRTKPRSAAARIAASEAALGHAKPAPAETGGKAAAIAAARTAAKAAYLEAAAKESSSLRSRAGGWLKLRSDKTPADLPASAIPAPEPVGEAWEGPPSRGKRALTVAKTLLIAASVAIVVIGAVQTAVELLLPNKPIAAPAIEAPMQSPTEPPEAASEAPAPITVPRRPMPTPQESPPAAPARNPDTTGQIDGSSSFFDPSVIVAPQPPRPEVTGSIPPAPPAVPVPVSRPPDDSTADALPASIGPALRSAVAGGNPAAEYELGTRYAEGRGIPQNFGKAAHWLERAADAGFAPAQFRLASLKEKGEGLKKDLQAARRLYLAAAGKGHVKAMHNLAVLYAEGIDGRPDYKVAAQWFRKAAGYGVTDSQYNLAILYARGIGVGANLAESYKWFALAAANGDSDAAKKRDEVAARLNPQTLMAAKLAVQTFVAEDEPEEAMSLRVPPGGWDRAPATPAKPRRRSPASAAR